MPKETKLEQTIPTSALEKLSLARTKFHARTLTKTGWNTYSEYHYFKLEDFLVPALEVFAEVGLLGVISFTKEFATMTIYNLADKTDTIVITSPMGSAALKAAHEVQNIGAVETYQRRYLWIIALEILEHEVLDASAGADPHTLMQRCETLADLQTEFAIHWKAHKGAEQKKISATYEECKKKFAPPVTEGTAGETSDQA